MTAEASFLDSWLRIDTTPCRGVPALFLDRDGTIIENLPYLADPEGVRLIDGAREAIRIFRANGYAVIMVTNQSGVARGLCSPEQYRAVEARVLEVLGPGVIDVVYACPFHPEGLGDFGREHSWRKPAAGMLFNAADRFGIDLSQSVMIGDSLSDMEAGARAGTRWLVHTLTGHGKNERSKVEAFSTSLNEISSTTMIRYVTSIAELAGLGFDA